jgi:hypothetical protein
MYLDAEVRPTPDMRCLSFGTLRARAVEGSGMVVYQGDKVLGRAHIEVSADSARPAEIEVKGFGFRVVFTDDEVRKLVTILRAKQPQTFTIIDC